MKCSKYKCPCCENYTLNHDVYGHYGEVCEVCLWQSDEIQDNNPNIKEGFNPVSLNEARENYKRIGAITEKYVRYARKPKKEELKKWKDINYYKLLENELLNNHSLAAFIFLIENEYELEFDYKNKHYLLRWINKNSKSCNLFLKSSEKGKSQNFESVIYLIEKGIIDKVHFLEVWKECKITNLSEEIYINTKL